MDGPGTAYIRHICRNFLNSKNAIYQQRKTKAFPEIAEITFTISEKTKGKLPDGTPVDTVPVGSPQDRDLGYRLKNGKYQVQRDPLRRLSVDGKTKKLWFCLHGQPSGGISPTTEFEHNILNASNGRRYRIPREHPSLAGVYANYGQGIYLRLSPNARKLVLVAQYAYTISYVVYVPATPEFRLEQGMVVSWAIIENFSLDNTNQVLNLTNATITTGTTNIPYTGLYSPYTVLNTLPLPCTISNRVLQETYSVTGLPPVVTFKNNDTVAIDFVGAWRLRAVAAGFQSYQDGGSILCENINLGNTPTTNTSARRPYEPQALNFWPSGTIWNRGFDNLRANRSRSGTLTGALGSHLFNQPNSTACIGLGGVGSYRSFYDSPYGNTSSTSSTNNDLGLEYQFCDGVRHYSAPAQWTGDQWLKFEDTELFNRLTFDTVDGGFRGQSRLWEYDTVDEEFVESTVVRSKVLPNLNVLRENGSEYSFVVIHDWVIV